MPDDPVTSAAGPAAAPTATRLHELTALQAAAAIRSREVSPVELVDHYLDRIERHGAELGAFTTVTAEAARSAARRAAAAVLTGTELPPLHGVPLAIKDLTVTAGVPTSFGSTVFADYVPDYDDDVVGFLAAAGTISLGKTNVPEFGLPCYTENLLGPPAVTPHDPTRLAGGSSGGAAAAVAGGLLPFAHGTDGGGSIRIPASVCGLVGIKSARGRVSRGPVGGDFVGLSVHGPLARTTADAAALLDALSVAAPAEPYFALPPTRGTFLQAAGRAPGRLRIAASLSTPVADVHLDPEVQQAFSATRDLLTDLGHDVVDAEFDFPDGLIDAFVLCWAALAAATPVPAGAEAALLPLTRHMRSVAAAQGAPALAAALAAVQVAARQLVRATLPFDVVLTPTVAQLPRPIGWFTGSGDPADDFARQLVFTPWTPLANLTGQPAVSVPLQWTDGGLPIGMQLLGRPGDEETLISLSAQLEAARPWHHHRPAVWSR